MFRRAAFRRVSQREKKEKTRKHLLEKETMVMRNSAETQTRVKYCTFKHISRDRIMHENGMN